MSTDVREIREIVEKNPKILSSLHPLERWVVEKLCKGLDKGEGNS